MQEKTQARRFLRLPELMQTVGYRRSQIYLKVKKGEFPAPISLGARAVGWLAQDVEQWIESRLKAAEGAQ